MVKWTGSARIDLRGFPKEAREVAGYQLFQVQQGCDPADWKPMSTVGPGVREIRVHTQGEHRVIYVAKFEDAVYVLHAFEKKTQKTRKADVEVARRRFREVLWHRSGRE